MTHTHNTYLTDNPLFKRNPVCGVCWRVCTELCEEWGGQINFDLLESMEVADKLCRRLILNTWTLCGIEYYYHWLEGQLGFSRPAVTCATATVCLSLRLMEDAPEPLQRLGEDMRGLLWGEGGELYDNMRSAARQQDICLSATDYGEIPPDPEAELKSKNEELEILNFELRVTNEQLQKQLNMSKKERPIIHVAGDYIAEQNIDIHDNTNCTIYATGKPQNQATEAGKTTEIEETPSEAETHFPLLTAQCIKEGKAEAVEAELRSAARGSALKLMQCIRTHEALGYLDTKNLSSQALYDALNAYFGLKYKYPNFAKYRRD